MQSDFPFLKITKRDRAIVGKKDPDTRIYRFTGVDDGPMRKGAWQLYDDKLDPGGWFDRLCERFPDEDFVSPGGVSMYVPVSRAAVYQRINAGKLTVFAYHPTKWSKTLFGGLRKTRKSPYMYIPSSECRAWAEELRSRVGDWRDPGWLPDKQYYAEEDKLDKWPKHKGKKSTPTWKRRKRRGKTSARGLALSVLGLISGMCRIAK